MMESFQGAGVECKSGTRSHTNGPVRCGLSHDWGRRRRISPLQKMHMH